MAQALYRKYRSRSLEDVVGQQNIIDALNRALQTNKISHAYLFTGPRGVGKTTVARILAHKVNQLDYNSDNMPIDIIEIDAASNRRIDEIRDLREKVKIAPVQSKYKVYIIDEVHMLTNEAFNALLKTLEEPPEHVIFILATTDAHKIPDTILSRTQRYNFKLANQSEVITLLKNISGEEGISIDDSALQIIAKQSGGSLRDALSLLDQIRHSSADLINEAEALEILGLASEADIQDLVIKIESSDLPACIEKLKSLESKNISPSEISNILADIYRQKMISSKQALEKQKFITKLLSSLILVEQSPRPELALEIAIMNYLIDSKDSSETDNHSIKHTKLSSLDNQPSLTISKPAPSRKKEIIAEPKVNISEVAPTDSNNMLTEELWKEMLEDLRSSHNTLYSVLRMSQLNTDNINDKIINLEFSFPFHQKRMSDSKNQQVILEKLANRGCTGYEIVCMVGNQNKNNDETAKVFSLTTATNESGSNDNNGFTNIKDIFGSVEVLE